VARYGCDIWCRQDAIEGVANERLYGWDDGRERLATTRIAGQRGGMDDELTELSLASILIVERWVVHYPVHTLHRLMLMTPRERI
jgi:hypothetical protein